MNKVQLFTSPIPTIVTTSNKGNLSHTICIPANAPWIEEAAAKTLTFITEDEKSTTYSDLGIGAIWSAFSALSGIY